MLEVKTDFPDLFKPKEVKVIKQAANSGLANKPAKEPEIPAGTRTVVAARSTSQEDRNKHKQTLRKYGIDVHR